MPLSNKRRALALCAASFILSTVASAAAQSQVIHGKRAVAAQHKVVNFAELARQEKLHPKPAYKRVHREPEPPKPFPVPPTAVPPFQAPAAVAAPEMPRPLSPALATNFAAAPDNTHEIPPDTQGAVGPNHLVTTLNGTFLIQNRSGGTISSTDLDTFWGVAGTFDPKILYDPFNNRWMTDRKSVV